MKWHTFLTFLPGILWFCSVLALTCLPGEDIPEIGWLTNIHFDKIVHFGMFGALVFLFHIPVFISQASSATRIRHGILITGLAILWGLAIEFIQKYWIPGRSFDLTDWAADSVGCLVALWLCIWIIRHEGWPFWVRK